MRSSPLVLLILAGCTDKGDADTSPEFQGPSLSHTPPGSALAGAPLDVTVTATDDDGVGAVSLFHRIQGETQWVLAPMEAAGSDTWTATLDGTQIAAPALEYYFKAEDQGESPATSYLPEGSTDAPYALTVSVEGLGLPYTEDFEPAEGETDLNQLGWGNSSGGFRGYPWQLSAAQAHGGGNSALHPHGYEGTPTIQDWLVSPAFDLSGEDHVQVSWYEYGNSTPEAHHGLYVSTGARDPADGAYEVVNEVLPAPLEDAWGRSAVYDLSRWAGKPAVYLAWYFEGVDADDWYMDDITVQTLAADLASSWSVAPAPVHPGDTAALTVSVVNSGTVAAEGLTVTVRFPDGGVTVGAESQDGGTVDAGASTSLDFALTVDPAATDNRYVPIEIELDWTGGNVVTDEQFIIGEPSTATVVWNATEAGSVQLVVGVGDPDAPTWEGTVYAGAVSKGEATYTLDITDEGAMLPPEAGAHRWYMRGVTETAGAPRGFGITYGGMDYQASDLPALFNGQVLVWLPEPPDLAATPTTSPSSVDPGTSGVGLSLNVVNNGAATTGALIATVSSSDADVTVVTPGPFTVAAGGLGAGARATVSGFTFDVSGAHTDSTPVNLTLSLSDDVESWDLPVSVAVPFPFLKVTGVSIDDGGDGILDAGEAADISFTVTNVGDEATVGGTSGVLTVEPSSIATADVPVDAESFGTLSANSSRQANPYAVQVTSGAAGDTLDFLLTLTDGARTYEARTSLVLGEPPWQSMEPVDDAVGDALEGWDFDLMSGDYRVLDDALQIRLHAAEPFDPTSLFIEAWGLSTGADYIYYRIVLQSGIVTLQGYDGTFVDLGEITVSYPDATTVEFDFPIASLGLLLNQFSVGWGSGWCGPDEYYCDHWPDNWGYPYDSFSTADWFDLSW